jgi:hypothetical protein
MSQSKVEKDRKNKVQAFKAQAKEQAKQAGIPKTHLVPLTEWETTDILNLRGDLLEAMEQQFVLTYQNLASAEQMVAEAKKEFQKAAQVMQMIMSTNIKAGKIRLKYSWNNGEDATEEDVKDYEAKMEKIREAQKKAFEDYQKQQNAEKTGLVGPDGQPVGTAQDLEDDTTDEAGDRATGMANEAAAAISQPENDAEVNTSAE